MTVPDASSVTGAGFSFVSTTCGTSLAPSGSCAVTIKFAPTSAAAFPGTLTIATGAGTRTAALSGTGAAPTVVFQPMSANWGTIGVASDSGDWPTIVNQSSVPVLITAHSVVSGPSGVWSWQGDSSHCQPGTTVLQPGASCQTFFGTGTLATPGTYSATDKISYQAVGVSATTFSAQQVYAFSMAATTATSAGLSFGNVIANTTSASQTFTLTNNATSSPVNISVAMVGSQPANFPMSNTCGTNLAAGASCTVTVSFNPTWVANGFSAAVQVSTTYPRMHGGTVEAYYYAAPVFSVPVSGNGAGAIATLTSPAAQSVGWQGSVTMTYRNDGGVAMTLAAPSLSTPLSLSSNNCSAVAPGASCSMVVADLPCCYSGVVPFTPTGTASPPATTSLTYGVYGVAARWSPTSVNLGTVNVGSSATQTVQLFNDGTDAADWTHHNILGNVPAGFTIVATTSSTGAGNCIAITQGTACNMLVTFTPTSGGSYGGSNITPGAGTPENTLSVSGTGNVPIAAFTLVSSTTSGTTNTTTFKNPNSVAVTPSASGLSATDGGVFARLSSNTCSGSVAANGTCTIVIVVAAPDCKNDNYSAHSYVTDAAGTASGAVVNGTTTKTICN